MAAVAWLKSRDVHEAVGAHSDAEETWKHVVYSFIESYDVIMDSGLPTASDVFKEQLGGTDGALAGSIRASACRRAIDGTTLLEFRQALQVANESQLDGDPSALQSLKNRWAAEYVKLLDIELLAGDKPLKAAGGAR